MENSKNDDRCISRRAFLIGSGAAVATTVLLNNIPGLEGKAIAAEVTTYPKKKIGRLSKLKANKPLTFKYPDDGKNSQSILVKLGTPAGGGIGRKKDVVAFNTLCTHMGGPMGRFYQSADKALGPCPFHQSTFDLTRHGMIVTGHATQSLPQVLLEVEGDDIYAVGLIGLIYGRYDNLKG
ncbi:MAG: arsenate reductase (azurin) small subunit [Deltaproteobacteria bacterium]|nr:arsenate reductase (azurin) small subunit [Deltaproteobacteria bacterium]